ncbi:SARP family transcriptional regulator [Asanoa ishikariensis]|uniref:NB-ARC domain-containing protein n=1 Tax=Asanoa ishikariensis TaxID=137265 RepID=A0A1H3TK41_9ACTN|nr:XRE family transcriptional regulator [Asanoa ishikariensis]GIF62263.1 SARP family transcriptional regulator [Asanoa ishikariensis]SDZ50614.1 NB-ARC domain-containing protein [Asanoa ishikariensis]
MDDEFAAQLRGHRLALRLTQEVLAERAGISARSVGEMERGRGRGPQPRTLERLATALELTDDARKPFVDAGRALFWSNRAAPAASPPVQVGAARHLPRNIADFVGRHDELALLDATLFAEPRKARLVAISGAAGVGKSALAIHIGHRLAARFPDGQLYAELGGENRVPAEPTDVLAVLLRMLGVDGSALPAGLEDRAAMFRCRILDRRTLLILDDAAGHRQVAPLLPPDGVATVITSRLALTGLPGAETIDLRPLPGRDSIELLRKVAGPERVQAEQDSANALVAACGNLPLAVRIVAARLAARPHWTLGQLGERLIDERRRLDELRHGDLSVRPMLQVTYRALSPAAARAFALLGSLCGTGISSVPEWAVVALLDSSPVAAAAAVDELLDARLLESTGLDQAGQQRYRFHEITRLYARERREAEISDAEWSASFARVAAGWLGRARLAREGLQCERFYLDDPAAAVLGSYPTATAVGTNAVEWFEAERDSLVALVAASRTAGRADIARGLAACAAEFFELRGYYDDWRRTMRTALDSCREAGDRHAEAAMLRGLGGCLVECELPDQALLTLRAARALAEQVGDTAGMAMASKDIGYMLGLAGQLDEAESELRAAVDGLDRFGRDSVKVIAMTNLAWVLRERGASDEAIDVVRAALRTARGAGDRFALAYASRGLAGALLAADRSALAERTARRAARLFEQINDPIGAAQSLRVQGEALAKDPARLVEAEQAFRAAAEIFRRRGHNWGLTLAELSLGEAQARRGLAGADTRLREVLRFWTAENVPALRARTLVALAQVAEQAGDPSAVLLKTEAYELYRSLKAPQAKELARQLGWDEDATYEVAVSLDEGS